MQTLAVIQHDVDPQALERPLPWHQGQQYLLLQGTQRVTLVVLQEEPVERRLNLQSCARECLLRLYWRPDGPLGDGDGHHLQTTRHSIWRSATRHKLRRSLSLIQFCSPLKYKELHRMIHWNSWRTRLVCENQSEFEHILTKQSFRRAYKASWFIFQSFKTAHFHCVLTEFCSFQILSITRYPTLEIKYTLKCSRTCSVYFDRFLATITFQNTG